MTGIDETRQIRSILRLLDDDSPKVRDRMWELVSANLPAWASTLRASAGGLASGPRRRLLDLLADSDREVIRSSWGEWRTLPGEAEKLEAALEFLSVYLARQAGEPESSLGPILDGLAAEYLALGSAPTPTGLARFLFVAKGLRGANTEYYDPRNSDLLNVLRTGRGIPISLACIYILVGRRLGLDIAGCDVPEHFLTRAQEGGKTVIIDCYDGGRALGRDRLVLLERKYAPDFNRLIKARASAESMVARVLRNLINAFHLAGRKDASEFMWTLAEELRGERDAGA
ncbi:MAG TPA: transglutaminase-like domain-containing protein [Fibrobacteria bacterium]|nr:transglutaminase-like domain-containing protein [Fibrobacteria bacterium]